MNSFHSKETTSTFNHEHFRLQPAAAFLVFFSIKPKPRLTCRSERRRAKIASNWNAYASCIDLNVMMY